MTRPTIHQRWRMEETTTAHRNGGTHMSSRIQALNAPLIMAIIAVFTITISFLRHDSHAAKNSVVGLAGGSLATGLFFICLNKRRTSERSPPRSKFVIVVQLLALAYLLYLHVLLSLTPGQARYAMTYFDKNLNKPLPEREYATHCELFTPTHPNGIFSNIRKNVDLFVFAHIFGWIAKSFLYRDVFFCWLWSIWFELCEYALAHILPNFRECWWDHVILDVFTCNALGIYLGHLVVYAYNLDRFNWTGIPENNKSVLWKAMWPYRVSPLQTHSISSKVFFDCALLLIISAIIELNCFFLKATLWIPPDHYLVTARLCLIALISLPASKAYYDWCSDQKKSKPDLLAVWIYFAILVAEVLISFKYSQELLDAANPTPLLVKVITITLTVALAGSFIYFRIWMRQSTGHNCDQEK